jgi:hypothetical protein
MGPERLSKIMTCERYFKDFRSTFSEGNTVPRSRKINREQTSEEKEFGKFFHDLIQCYVTNLGTIPLGAYLTELIECQSNEKWTAKLIGLLSPHYDTKTPDSYLSSGSSENMERYLNRFSLIYQRYNLSQFRWESEKSIRNFDFDKFQFKLDGDIDLVGINEGEKKIFLIELKKAQKPYPQWKYQLYLYMLMAKSEYDEYQIFGAIWHPGAKLKPETLELAEAGIQSSLEGNTTNPIAYICEDCKVWTCEDRK